MEITEGALIAAIDNDARLVIVPVIFRQRSKIMWKAAACTLRREYTRHGVGRKMHEGPQVPNYGTPGTGVLFVPGMTIAIEPMVLVGTYETRTLSDQWTVVSADGSLTAHFEHSVAVTEGDPLVLTVP